MVTIIYSHHRLADLSFIKYVYQILAVNEFSGLVFTCAGNT